MATTVNILILDRKKFKVTFWGQSYNTCDCYYVEEWCKQQNVDLCFNLGLFNMYNHRACNYVRSSKGDLAYGGASNTLVLDNANQCKGYSNAIIDGVVKINRRLDSRARTRNGIGLTTTGEVIIAQSPYSYTELTFAKLVNSKVKARGYKVKLFVLQDGGGSTSEYSNISNTNFAPEGRRKVATVTYVKFLYVPKFERVLKKGSKGSDVEELQIMLGGLDADGSFGPKTKTALLSVQKKLGLKQTGILDEATGIALSKRIKL